MSQKPDTLEQKAKIAYAEVVAENKVYGAVLGYFNKLYALNMGVIAANNKNPENAYVIDAKAQEKADKIRGEMAKKLTPEQINEVDRAFNSWGDKVRGPTMLGVSLEGIYNKRDKTGAINGFQVDGIIGAALGAMAGLAMGAKMQLSGLWSGVLAVAAALIAAPLANLLTHKVFGTKPEEPKMPENAAKAPGADKIATHAKGSRRRIGATPDIDGGLQGSGMFHPQHMDAPSFDRRDGRVNFEYNNHDIFSSPPNIDTPSYNSGNGQIDFGSTNYPQFIPHGLDTVPVPYSSRPASISPFDGRVSFPPLDNTGFPPRNPRIRR